MTDKIRIAIQESELSEEVIEMAREYYSNEWSKSSFEYEKKGFYKWCANSIEGQRRVLELGCGCGFSTYSMLSNNHEVVAIEENPFMLDHAEKLLTKRNCEFEIIRRGNLIFNNPSYQIQYSDMTNDQTQRNLLVEGDFLVDEKLNTWLICTEKFDAIACWFLGVHGVMTANVDHVQQYGFTKYDPVEYRLNFQRQLFAKADLVPSTSFIAASISKLTRLISFKSSPDIFIPTGVLMPVEIISIRILIG